MDGLLSIIRSFNQGIIYTSMGGMWGECIDSRALGGQETAGCYYP